MLTRFCPLAFNAILLRRFFYSIFAMDEVGIMTDCNSWEMVIKKK